jgi:hypothetical protein
MGQSTNLGGLSLKYFALFFIILPLTFGMTSTYQGITFQSITTSPYPIKDRWVRLPKKDDTLTIYIRTDGAEKLHFYLAPTGTATYNERVLIGSATGTNENFIFKWKFLKNQTFLHHFIVEATNSKNEIETDIPFNIISD